MADLDVLNLLNAYGQLYDEPIDALKHYCEIFPELVDVNPITLIVKSLNTETINMDEFIQMMNVLSKYKNHNCDNIDVKDLRSIIVEIQESDFKSLLDKVHFFENKYPSQIISYPTLFIKVLSENVNIVELTKMLDMVDKIKNKNISQYDASVKVGEGLFNKYVKKSS